MELLVTALGILLLVYIVPSTPIQKIEKIFFKKDQKVYSPIVDIEKIGKSLNQ